MASGTISQPVESLLGNVSFAELRQSSTTTSDTFVVPNNARHLLFLIDTRNDMTGLYSVSAYGAGGVTCTPLTTTQTAITVDTSVTNRLTLTHTSRQITYFDIVLRGAKLKFA